MGSNRLTITRYIDLTLPTSLVATTLDTSFDCSPTPHCRQWRKISLSSCISGSLTFWTLRYVPLLLYLPHTYARRQYITRSIRATKGGLQEIAEELGVSRPGLVVDWQLIWSACFQVQRVGQLQAGSDALLTSMTFFKMREHYFPDQFDESKYRHVPTSQYHST